jgi:uncharacterized protein (DUF433 family)
MPDVAAILDLPVRKVRRWLQDYWNAQFGQSSGTAFSAGTGSDLVVNFHTLIEFYVFYQLRTKGVSVQRIVDMHRFLEAELQTPHPFATVDVLADKQGNVLFTGRAGELVRADKSLQIVIKEVLMPFYKKIEFGANNIAERFYPLGRESSVVVDPRRKFGQPVIGDTNITTDTVSDMYQAGESQEFIARIYDLTAGQVADAIAYTYRNAA